MSSQRKTKGTILVTGGAGFIGSHTVVELLNLNYEVIIVDNFCNSKEEVINRIKLITNKDVKLYKIDICDIDELRKVFEENKIDVVMHFAALKSGADSIKFPELYYKNNIGGLENLVSLMEEYGVEKIIFSSSATVYGNSKNVPILESEPTGNVLSPYGKTKCLNEAYLKEHSEKLKRIKAIAFRYFNPIGAHPSGLLGEDSPDDIPNNLMLYLLKVANKELPYLRIFGNDYNTPDGSGIRDYIHVVDLALGHIAAIDYFDKMSGRYEVFNLGTGRGHTVYELVHTFEQINNVKIPCVVCGRRDGDVEISYACVDKANNLLGWKAKYNLSDCLLHAWKFKQLNNK